MGNKIFISYKYADNHVQPIGMQTIFNQTTARDYVTEIQTLLADDHINKGEKDEEPLAHFKDSTIASKLRDKIWDSSISIVVISKGMKNQFEPESEQWIPWEVAYSLKEHRRGDKVSRSNALLAVVLPDESNSYEYYIQEHTCAKCDATIYRTDTLFNVLAKNMFNIKNSRATYSDCPEHQAGTIYFGEHSYIQSVRWSEFKLLPNVYIDRAIEINNNIDNYQMYKQI